MTFIVFHTKFTVNYQLDTVRNISMTFFLTMCSGRLPAGILKSAPELMSMRYHIVIFKLWCKNYFI